MINMKLTESDINRIVNKVLLEQYDAEKLYDRPYVVNRVKNGPRELKKYIKELPVIGCWDSMGNPQTCTKIPEVIYVFLTGRYL
jgi:hypothetical protein